MKFLHYPRIVEPQLDAMDRSVGPQERLPGGWKCPSDPTCLRMIPLFVLYYEKIPSLPPTRRHGLQPYLLAHGGQILWAELRHTAVAGGGGDWERRCQSAGHCPSC